MLTRPETKDPWTVKDVLAHITHWKAGAVRKIKRRPIPVEEKGLNWTDGNHLIYERWRVRSSQEVLAWHRQVQVDVLAVLQATPVAWFSNRERRPEWPFDLDGHSSYHRVNDIEYGSGYRVYFVKQGQTVIVLLAGGDKSTQATDIRTALRLARNL